MRVDRPYTKLVKHRDDRGDTAWLWRGVVVLFRVSPYGTRPGRWICRHFHRDREQALACAERRLAASLESC